MYAHFLNDCQRTSIIENTLNPVFDTTLMMDFNYFTGIDSLTRKDYLADVIIEVYDKDDLVRSLNTKKLPPDYLNKSWGPLHIMINKA